MQETWIQSLGWENPLENEMVTHSSILAWEIPWTEEPDYSPWSCKRTHPLLAVTPGTPGNDRIFQMRILWCLGDTWFWNSSHTTEEKQSLARCRWNGCLERNQPYCDLLHQLFHSWVLECIVSSLPNQHGIMEWALDWVMRWAQVLV